MVNNTVVCAAIMTLCHVALTSFLNVASLIGIVNVISLVYLFLFYGSHNSSSLGSVKSSLHNLKSCVLEGNNTRASGIGGYCPHLLKNQCF